jgi:hypothetical protein
MDQAEAEKLLGFRIVNLGGTGFQAQRIGDKGKVTAVRPASESEYKMFRLLCQDSTGRV